MINLLGFPYSVVEILDKETPQIALFSWLQGENEVLGNPKNESPEWMKNVTEVNLVVKRAEELSFVFS